MSSYAINLGYKHPNVGSYDLLLYVKETLSSYALVNLHVF